MLTAVHIAKVMTQIWTLHITLVQALSNGPNRVGFPLSQFYLKTQEDAGSETCCFDGDCGGGQCHLFHPFA